MPPKLPIEFKLFDEMIESPCHAAEDLVIGARELILSSEATADCNVTVAKASQGSRILVLAVDRDNYEFSYRTMDGRWHVEGGWLACDLRGISVEQLKQMMVDYLAKGTPIVIPDRIHRPSVQPQQRRKVR